METKQLTQAGTNRDIRRTPHDNGLKGASRKGPTSVMFECGPLGLSETRSQGLGEVLLDSPAGVFSLLTPLRNPESSG